MRPSPLALPLLLLPLIASAPSAGEIIVDGASIQDALAVAQPGDTVIVPAGTYHENVVVTTSDLRLVGQGAVVDGQFAGPCLAVAADGVTITGFVLVNGGTTSGAGPNILLYEGSDAVVTGNTLAHGAGVALNVMGDDATITGNTIDDCDGGGIRYVAAESSSRTLIADNVVTRARFGISGRRGELTVTGNRLERLDGSGLDLDPITAIAALHVRDNVVRNAAGIGIDVDATTGVQLYLFGNEVERTGDVGIDVDATGAVRVDVMKNRVRDTIGDGLQVDAAGLTFLSRNRVEGARGHGIVARGTGFSELRLERNVVQDVGRNGLLLQGEPLLVIDNDVRRTVLAGIDSLGNTSQLARNVVRDAGRQGLRHEGENGLITDNVVTRSGRDGLLVLGGGHALHDNRACDNGGDGIDLNASGPGALGTGNVLTGNVCLRNAHEGIDNTALATVIEHNRAAQNAGALGPDIAGAGNDLDGDGNGDGTVSSFQGNTPAVQLGAHAPGSPTTGQRLDLGEQEEETGAP